MPAAQDTSGLFEGAEESAAPSRGGTSQSLVLRDGLAIIGCVTNPEQIDAAAPLPRAEDCAGARETAFSSIGITVAKRNAALDLH